MELFFLEEFLDVKSAELISDFCRSQAVFGGVKHTFSCLGQSSSLAASKISEDNPIYPYTGDHKKDLSISLICKSIVDINKHVSEIFKVKSSLVQVCYQALCPGSRSDLHSDSTDLYGNPGTPDEKPEIQEFSAVLYLNTCGEDYEGGEIIFPKQNLSIEPKVGQLIIFRGNQDYPHMIQEVTRGIRESIPMFFGRAENISDRGITSFV
jgi:hypothetical protein